MFSLQVLFSRKDVFFDLLEASAEEARGSVRSLIQIIQQPGQAASLNAFAESRRKDKQITEQITEELCRAFITPLEREDIEALSTALYKIPKTVEKFAERFVISGAQLARTDFSRHVPLLEEATDTLLAMVRRLRKRVHLDQIRDENARLQKIEGAADKLMLELLRELYTAGGDPWKALILRDLYELLEKIIDRCRDAGNVISQVVLKNS